MTTKKKILMSGGSGLLGTAMQIIDPNIIAPSHSEMDVTDIESIKSALDKHRPDVFLHAAAFTSPPRCDEEPMCAIEHNIIGTANAVMAAVEANVRLVYISTDYVFKGDKGNYSEGDEVLPQNIYAWSKLGGECSVRAYDNSLIIRTSFYPNEFPYDAAFVDQHTSRDTVDTIAKLIYQLLHINIVEPVIHVGTDRKTVKELALAMGKSDVKDLHRNDVNFATPADTSFDLTKLKQQLS